MKTADRANWKNQNLSPKSHVSQIMSSRFRFVFVVFYLAAILIFTVCLRAAENRNFYRLCTIEIKESRLKQQLWQKQLQLESLINPAALSQRLDEQ